MKVSRIITSIVWVNHHAIIIVKHVMRYICLHVCPCICLHVGLGNLEDSQCVKMRVNLWHYLGQRGGKRGVVVGGGGGGVIHPFCFKAPIIIPARLGDRSMVHGDSLSTADPMGHNSWLMSSSIDSDISWASSHTSFHYVWWKRINRFANIGTGVFINRFWHLWARWYTVISFHCVWCESNWRHRTEVVFINRSHISGASSHSSFHYVW